MKTTLGNFANQISIIDLFLRLVLSIAIGSVIGLERERKNRPAGLRTHALVCMGACLIAIVEQEMVYEINKLASETINLSFGHLSVGVITGIGFIGAGTIMMSKSKVVGLTTAASLWCTACLGLIDGMGYCTIALISAILVLAVLKIFSLGEKRSLSRVIEIDFIDDDIASNEIEDLLNKQGVRINDYSLAFTKEDEIKHCTIRYSITFKDKKEIHDVMSRLSDIHNVKAVKYQNIM